jgi:hypothetical protein
LRAKLFWNKDAAVVQNAAVFGEKLSTPFLRIGLNGQKITMVPNDDF